MLASPTYGSWTRATSCCRSPPSISFCTCLVCCGVSLELRPNFTRPALRGLHSGAGTPGIKCSRSASPPIIWNMARPPRNRVCLISLLGGRSGSLWASLVVLRPTLLLRNSNSTPGRRDRRLVIPLSPDDAVEPPVSHQKPNQRRIRQMGRLVWINNRKRATFRPSTRAASSPSR